MRFLASCVLALLACAPAAAQPAAKVPILLDCDIGTDIDDTFALALAVASPELDLRGVTTVSGDTQTRARMACRLLTAAGRRDVPVAAGRPDDPPQPLRGWQAQYAGHPAVLFGRTAQPQKQDAVAFLYEKLKAEPGRLTLVAVGPLSNVARLFTEHPDCKPWLKRVVIMGGAVRVGYENRPPAEPEFNIRADPKAARVVFTSGVPLTVAPLDATTMLQLDRDMLGGIFGAGALLNDQVRALYQLWDQPHAPTMYDPVAVTLAFADHFCKMEDLRLEVDDKGLTREVNGRPNARVATGIDKDAYRKWLVDRFAAMPANVPAPGPPVNVSQTVARGGLPNRVHAFEDYETDIERRWWLAGKLETADVPAGSQRACRGVLTQDFDDRLGELRTMYTAVVFNPVPGPPLGRNPRLAFRYKLQGTGTLRVQIYSLSKGYHRCLTLTGLPQGRWQEAAVDMTAARRPDGSGGPLSEGERIDDVQFYADRRAELLIDDVVLHDAGANEKRPFPAGFAFTGWFDTGKQGKEWPGNFTIVPGKGHFWHAAAPVSGDRADEPTLRLHLRGERPLGGAPRLFLRYRMTGGDTLPVGVRHEGSGRAAVTNLTGLRQGEWAEAEADFPAAGEGGASLTHADTITFRPPAGAELLIDDVLLYRPGR